MQRIALLVAKLLVPTHGDISIEKPLEDDPLEAILKPVRKCELGNSSALITGLGLGAAAETRDTLRPDLRAALEACNACDLALYDAAAERHAAQLRYLDGLGS